MRTCVRDRPSQLYSQFKRALKRQNFMLAWTMAAELPKVPLADGLELLLLARDLEPTRFDRGVPRWHARLCTERQLSSGEAQLALAALNALPGPWGRVRRSVARRVVRGPRSQTGGSGAGGLARRSRHLIPPYALRGKRTQKSRRRRLPTPCSTPRSRPKTPAKRPPTARPRPRRTPIFHSSRTPAVPVPKT
jgi:hypothetical protein